MKKLKNLLQDSRGMAIIMVTSSIAILAVLLADFTFETKLNAIRVENQIDRFQAKLNAEAGVKFALAKLKIYQEAWNMLEDNESMKSTVSPADAESVVTQPFIYPITLPPSANIIQKNAVADFEKNSLIKGGMAVSLNSITGFLNPNTLKVIKTTTQEDQDDQDDQDDQNNSKKQTPQQFMEKTFIETIEREIKNKIETDEDFANKYSNVDPNLLVKELKFYINNPNDYDEPEKPDVEKLYQNSDTQPKHAALESIDELYMLEGWEEDIVNLIKDKMSVHQVSVINLNEITDTQLRVLFPALTDLQIEEFFKYRDGDPEQGTDPQPFRSAEDFKQYLTQKSGVVEGSDYDKRVKEFENAKILLGVAGKLFKVTSQGTFGDSKYQITAYIDLPVKPDPPKTEEEKKKEDQEKKEDDQDGQDDQNEGDNNGQDQGGDDKEKDKKKTYLLNPRIVEIRSP